MGAPFRLEFVDPYRLYEHRDPEDFDRLAFAMRALGVIRPHGMTVALYRRSSDLRVDQGRDLACDGASWAMVGIPPHATRESIAVALAELAGLDGSAYIVDVLVAEGSRQAS